jgi:hypothetical protein
MLANTGNPKMFWKAVKEAENSRRCNKIIVEKNGKELSSQLAAEEFTTFFDEKVKQLSNNAGAYRSPLLDEQGSDLFVNEDLEKAIKQLSPKMCVRFDRIPSKALKLVAPFVIDTLVKIFNQICRNGIPEVWMITVVRPLHKSGSKKECTNYCPISNLCSMAKLSERCILQKLDELPGDLQGENQHGFRHLRSTTTALILINFIVTFDIRSMVNGSINKKTLTNENLAIRLFISNKSVSIYFLAIIFVIRELEISFKKHKEKRWKVLRK